MERNPPSALPEPYIHPSVAQDPAALRYQEGIAARRAANALPKADMPVAGGSVPPIPRLDGPVQKGMTMEAMAAQQRGQYPGQHLQHQGGSGIVEPVRPPQAAPALNIAPIDVLPKEAAADPAFQQGMGSMLASAQPHLAAKYGVYRNGKFIPPQALQQGGQARLRPETVQGLEMLSKLQQEQASNPTGALPEDERAVDRAVAAGPAGAAARVGNLPGDKNVDVEESRSRLKEVVEKMDEFDFDSFRQSMMRDILNNPEQKGVIEARLQPLDITDMIVTGYVKQDVPIISNKLTFTYRSMTGEEDLEIKRLVMTESKSLEISDRYLLDKYAFMSMTIGLVAINGKPLGDVYDSNGGFSDDQFWTKYKRVIRLPLHMLASIGLNQMWFEQRARKLYVAEKVGNG